MTSILWHSSWFWLWILVWELGQQVKVVQAFHRPIITTTTTTTTTTPSSSSPSPSDAPLLMKECVTWEKSRTEYSLVKPYYENYITDTWRLKNNWDFSGSTMVTEKFIRLTPDAPLRYGSLWNTMPVDMKEWEVQLDMTIHGKMGSEYGDGIIFWYVQDGAKTKFFYPNENDKFIGLAITLDTFKNQTCGVSSIDAMLNNGSMSYHEDRGGRHTYYGHGCEAKVRQMEHPNQSNNNNNNKLHHVGNPHIFRLRIRYQDHILTVFLAQDLRSELEHRPDEWTRCLKVSNVYLPTVNCYFGISASTSNVSDNHDLLSVKTIEIERQHCHETLSEFDNELNLSTDKRSLKQRISEKLIQEPLKMEEANQFNYKVVALSFICFFVIVTAYAGCWPQTPV